MDMDTKRFGTIFLSFILIYLLAGVGLVRAQDMHLSQMYTNPLYVNPAFAGSSSYGRISTAYRNQWPNVGGGFSLASVSYDQYFREIHGSIGAYVDANFHASGGYREITAAFMYAFNAKLTEQLSLSLSVHGSYTNRYVNWETLTFPDQFSPSQGLMPGLPTQESLPDLPGGRFYGDVGVGALLYGKYFYVGVSAYHLPRPDVGFTAEYRLPIRYSAQVGGVISSKKSVYQSGAFSDWSISPNIVFTHQGVVSELNYGVYATFRPMIAGVWFRQSFSNPDALIFMLGGEFKGVQIAYSYDLTVSKLKKSGGGHEVSLRFKIPYDKNRTDQELLFPVPCPEF